MRFEIYRTLWGALPWSKRQFSWRLRAGNNRITASAGESFHNKGDCKKSIEGVVKCDDSTPVDDLTDRAEDFI